jgi:hypothetical protein
MIQIGDLIRVKDGFGPPRRWNNDLTDHKGFFEKNNIGLVISLQSQQYYCEIITDDEIRCWVLESLIEKIK